MGQSLGVLHSEEEVGNPARHYMDRLHDLVRGEWRKVQVDVLVEHPDHTLGIGMKMTITPPKRVKMTVLRDLGDSTALRCVCGTEFVADACTEENCYLVTYPKRHNVPQCPNPSCRAISR